MARALTQTIQDQIDQQRIKRTHVFTVAGVDRSAYLVGWDVSANREFGSAAATFLLNNDDALFGDGGASQINVGDTVQLIEKYSGDATEWKRFYGVVVQRPVRKSSDAREVELTCLDYISTLQYLDIDLEVEGTKVEVQDEELTPNFLPAPNDSLAQVFDFSKDAIAANPRPIIMIRDNTNDIDTPQFDGFEILYEQGQLKLGSPLSAVSNYSVVARSYHYYAVGTYVEDILEQILTQVDGYGTYLFKETSAADVITDHLTETFLNVEGTSTDFLTPNFTTETITIRHQLSSGVSEGATSIELDSVEGLPSSGSGEINGDVFTWSSISGTQLQGIPSSGSNSLKSHEQGDYLKYESTYAAGRVWYMKYSNLTSTLTSSDFAGISGATLSYVDRRFGRIILSTAISIVSNVRCTSGYTFKTLQATGIELSRISFRSRELENRFEAVQKLRTYVAPNYIIRTQGDDKIWASYLRQKTTADYDLTLIQKIDYLEDSDLYTRVIFYGKNNNPTNLMFNEGVDFVSSGETFKALATNNTLAFAGEEGNYYVYGTALSGVGYIEPAVVTPVVKVNGIAIDNKVHTLFQMPVMVELTTRTETRTGCHGVSKEQYFKSHTYFYYKVFFAHTSLDPNTSISLHNATGVTLFTISPNDANMDYARGVYHVPGENENSSVTLISTATYGIMYSSNALVIDYDNIFFKIDKNLIIDPVQTTVQATYEYWTVFTSVFDVAAIVDGRFDTQVQTEFFQEPPSGFRLAIIDLGAEYTIQAIDIVAGFFKPDEQRKFDIDMRFSLQYSTDNITYFDISDETSNIKLSGGESASFEEDVLGGDFTARYLLITLDNVKRIDYNNGEWVTAFTEVAAYNNIIIKGEAQLIPTTTLTSGVTTGSTTVPVSSTSGFASSGTAYIEEDTFTYTGKTATSFTGVSGISSSHLTGDRVHKTIAGDTTMYDDSALLPKLGDRVFKRNLVSDDVLYSQEQLDRLALAFLQEFYKEHTKRTIQVLYAPYLHVGQTVSLTDPYNDEDNVRYFVESVADRNGFYEIVVAKYPA